MAVQFEKYHQGQPTGYTVWADEPDDIYGEGDSVQQAKSQAAAIIARMDGSKKWRRLAPLSGADLRGPDLRVGPELEKAISEAKRTGSADLTRSPKKAKSQPTQAAVRAWAKEQGIEVNPMGRVPKDVIDQYTKAHEG